MSHGSLAGSAATDRPCWHCTHWGGWAWEGPAGRCTRPNSAAVQAIPERGCAYWTREPGADDESGPPPLPGQASSAP